MKPLHSLEAGMMAKILVIDDESSIRGLLATVLERKGYTVVLADSGVKGLELFTRERPEVIVLDLKMPEIDGLAVPPSAPCARR